MTINRIWLTHKNKIWKQRITVKVRLKSKMVKFPSTRLVKIIWRFPFFILMWTLKRVKNRELLFTIMIRLLIWLRSLATNIVIFHLFRAVRWNDISTRNIASATNGHCAGEDLRRVWWRVLFCLLINIWIVNIWML